MYIYFAECRASSDEHMANGGRTNGVITEVPYRIIQSGPYTILDHNIIVYAI